METIRVPFHIAGMYGGAAKLEGFVILGPAGLTLEFRLRDTIFGAFTGGVQTREFAFTDLEDAEGGLGFFSPWLQLAACSLSVFDGLPTPDPGHLRLRVPWKYRRQLRALTSEINLQLSYREADRYRSQLSDRGA